MSYNAIMLSRIKYLARAILGGRPYGLRRLGKGSIVRPPYRLINRKFISIGDRTQVYEGSHICALSQYAGVKVSGKVAIGDDVYIGRQFYIGGAAIGIEVGDRCVLSERVSIFDNSHGLDPAKGKIMDQPLTNLAPVVIGCDSFLGINVIVLPGVTIGRHCVIGAGAVVTRNIPDFCVAAGVPAKVLRKVA